MSWSSSGKNGTSSIISSRSCSSGPSGHGSRTGRSFTRPGYSGTDGGSLSSANLSSLKDDISLDLTLNSDHSKFDIDQSVLPNPEYNNKRRTVILERNNFEESFGFAIQSYVFKRGTTGSTERITYVDYVRDRSAACKSGIRRGDVIVAVNGCSVIGESHASLVLLMTSQLRMRLVLLFQNIARIIQLSARSLQLQYILKEKQRMLETLEKEERRILDGTRTLSSVSASASTSGSSLPGLGPSDADGMISRNLEPDHPDDPSPLTDDSFNTTDGIFSDPLGVGLTTLVRVDSHASLAAQVTRL